MLKILTRKLIEGKRGPRILALAAAGLIAAGSGAALGSGASSGRAAGGSVISAIRGIITDHVPLSDVSTAFAEERYTPVEGGKTTFNKYLIVRAGTHVPHVSFTYSAAPGEAQRAQDGSMQVLAGTGAPTISATVFSPADETYAQVRGGDIDIARTAGSRGSGQSAESAVQFDADQGERYAVRQAEVDFTGVQFDEPGIYRYVISEEPSSSQSAAGIVNDTDSNRILDVYVTDEAGALKVSSYVLHLEDDAVTAGGGLGSADASDHGEALDDKTDGFTNEYKSSDLAFKHEVKGNQASRDKYFKYTLKLENLTPGDEFTVSIADDGDPHTTDGNADAESGSNSATAPENAGKVNALTLIAGDDGTIEQNYYLQHGQSIAVRGLPVNASYALAEDPEDYKKEGAVVSGYTDPVQGTMETDRKTSYRNERSGVIPTGVFAAILPGIILLATALAGIAALRKMRRA